MRVEQNKGAMDLLERFREGDRDAFEELFRQFQGRIYSWVVRIVRDPGVAEELTVESFWRIYRARGRFNPSQDFGGWAYRIATNLALNHLRRRRPESPISDSPLVPVSAERDPAIDGELRERIRHAFVRLPARFQVAATLALVEECSYQEIAQVLGIAEGTVKSRVFRAVRILRKQLKGLRIYT